MENDPKCQIVYFKRDSDIRRIIRIYFVMENDRKDDLFFFDLSTFLCRFQVDLLYPFLKVKLIINLLLTCIERVIAHLHHEGIVNKLAISLFSTLKIIHFPRFP